MRAFEFGWGAAWQKRRLASAGLTKAPVKPRTFAWVAQLDERALDVKAASRNRRLGSPKLDILRHMSGDHV